MNREKNLDWQATLEAIQTTHTLNIYKICEMMKASRVFVGQYIVYNLENIKDENGNSTAVIYLPSGKGTSTTRKDGTTPKRQINYIYLAARALNRPDILKAVKWFSKEEFDNLLRKSIFSVTRQTIQVPVEVFVADKAKLFEEYREINEKIKQLNDELRPIMFAESEKEKSQKLVKELNKAKSLHERRWLDFVNEEDKNEIKALSCISKARSKVEHTPCECDVIAEMNNWVALHDEIGYSGTAETVLRKFFKEGYIRVEFQIEGKSDSQKKIYYIPDRKKPFARCAPNLYLTVEYKVWLEYLKDHEDINASWEACLCRDNEIFSNG